MTPTRRALARRHPRLLVSVAVAVLVADQLTKWLALQALGDGRIIDVLWKLRLRLVFNTGAAFGTFQGLGPVIAAVTVVVLVVLLASRGLPEGRFAVVAAGAITGAAAGNLADRVFRSNGGLLDGAVVDFIDVQFWPVWNVADMAVVFAAGALAWSFGAAKS